MKIFSGSSNKPLAESIARAVGKPVSPIEISIFPDGEKRIRILENVVNEDTVIVQPTADPVDSNLMELFFIADGLSRSGAKSVLAVIPYLGYQRQDHVFRDGEAVSLEVVAKVLQVIGIDRVLTFDLHSVRIPEAFDVPVSHVSAIPLFAKVIKSNIGNSNDTILVSPDMGGIRRVKILSELLDNLPYAIVEKKRDLVTGKVEAVHVQDPLGSLFSVDGAGFKKKRAIILDDMIASGATVVQAAALLKSMGVNEVIVYATHAVLSTGASKLLQESTLDKVFITDSVLVPESKKFKKLEVLSIAEIIADELKLKS